MDWIRAGKIRVDGRAVTDPLTWVDLDQQQITREDESRVDGVFGTHPSEKHLNEKRWVSKTPPTLRLVIALHKPNGVVTTRRDERGRKTVYDLLPPGLPWVFPAGRLDADSEGLLILTNDSALAVRLTEPAHAIPKTYHVTLDAVPTAEDLQRLRIVIELADSLTRPARVRRMSSPTDVPVLEVVLT